jgi:Kef-type K+ transport system membrane component KefB
LLAGVFALALRLRIDTRSDGVALGLLALLGAAMGLGRDLGLSTVLLPLLAGMFLRRWHEGPVLWPRQFGLLGAALTLVLFVVVGSAWTPGLLGPVVLLACAVLVVRQLGKMALSAVFGHGLGFDRRQLLSQGLGLAPMSGTTLVLLADTHHRQPELMAPIAALIMACIVLMELLGPLAVALALRLAGESPATPSDGRSS